MANFSTISVGRYSDNRSQAGEVICFKIYAEHGNCIIRFILGDKSFTLSWKYDK